jgi:centromere/kinetochore protein ZW10
MSEASVATCRARLEEVDARIGQFALALSVGDLENDAEFARTHAGRSASVQEANRQLELRHMSLFQLNARAQEYEQQLQALNRLWLLHGLVVEVQGALGSRHVTNNPQLGSSELEAVFFNLDKLGSKLATFREEYPSVLIVERLVEHHEALYDLAVQQVKQLFERFFPQPYTFVNPITVEGEEVEYNGEFVAVFLQYAARGSSELVVALMLHAKQTEWDGALDACLVRHECYWHLEATEEAASWHYQLQRVPAATPFVLAGYFDSVSSFIRFVNLLENQPMRNFYLSKILRRLTDAVSHNVNRVIGDPQLTLQLVEVVELSRRTNWSLSIANSLRGDIVASLQELYMDWLADEYVDKVRAVFTDEAELREMFTRLVDAEGIGGAEGGAGGAAEAEVGATRLGPDTAKTDDGWGEWDDGWDEPPVATAAAAAKPPVATSAAAAKPPVATAAAVAASDDEWDAWDDETDVKLAPPLPAKAVAHKAASGRPAGATHFKVTAIPRTLLGIVLAFVRENPVLAGPELPTALRVPLLITAIVSFTLITYPSLQNSFILYNDLSQLHRLLATSGAAGITPDAIAQLRNFAHTSWLKLKLDLLPYLTTITKGISLQHDDYVADGEFALDGATRAQLDALGEWFNKFADSATLEAENAARFAELLEFYIDFVHNWLVDSILLFDEITEYQLAKLALIIAAVRAITQPIAAARRLAAKSLHRLDNVDYLISNHLKDIMERFYQGEFFDLEAHELIAVITSVFVKSELRDGYIQEIVDIRNLDND